MLGDPNNCYHPDDPEGNFDYEKMPDVVDYFKEDGDFDRFEKDYDEWEEEQYNK